MRGHDDEKAESDSKSNKAKKVDEKDKGDNDKKDDNLGMDFDDPKEIVGQTKD